MASLCSAAGGFCRAYTHRKSATSRGMIRTSKHVVLLGLCIILALHSNVPRTNLHVRARTSTTRHRPRCNCTTAFRIRLPIARLLSQSVLASASALLSFHLGRAQCNTCTLYNRSCTLFRIIKARHASHCDVASARAPCRHCRRRFAATF